MGPYTNICPRFQGPSENSEIENNLLDSTSHCLSNVCSVRSALHYTARLINHAQYNSLVSVLADAAKLLIINVESVRITPLMIAYGPSLPGTSLHQEHHYIRNIVTSGSSL